VTYPAMKSVMKRRREELRAVEAAKRDANRAAKAEVKRLRVLVGRTINVVDYDPTNEGTYILTLDDGKTVTFSSSGDDMTFTSCGIEEVQP
jgi:hypothetical protein